MTLPELPMYPLAWVQLAWFAVSAILSAAASYAAYALTAKKPRRSSAEDRPPTYAARGSFAPIIIGRRLIGPRVTWVGSRTTNTGGDDVTTYNERAMHVLCVGPGDALYAIYKQGKKIWPKKGDPFIRRATTPDGSEFECIGGSIFRIFWGTREQLPNALLVEQQGQLGVRSGWPNFMYIHWTPFKLTTSPIWSELLYEVEVRPQADPPALEGSAPWMERTTPEGDPNFDPGNIAGLCRDLGNAPAGTYSITYVRGAMRYSSLTPPKWRVHGQNPTGFYIQGTGLNVKCPGNSAGYDSQDLCEAANTGATVSFVWGGGNLSLCMVDDAGFEGTENNHPGNPNPTFRIEATVGGPFDVTMEGTHKNNETSTIGLDGQPGLYASVNDGANPAHVIHQVMTAPYPHGIAMPADQIHGDGIEALGGVAEDDHLPVNVVADDGSPASDLIGDLMNDVGFAMPQVSLWLYPKAIRPPLEGESFPALDEDAAVDPEPELEQHHGDFSPDRVVFMIKDEANRYRDMDVSFDEDAQPRLTGRVQPNKVELPTITDRLTGVLVGKRRLQEVLNQKQVFRFPAVRDARLLTSGFLVLYPGVGLLRVIDNKISWKTTRCELSAVLDQYSFLTGDYFPPGIVGPPGGSEPPASILADAHFRVFPAPPPWGNPATQVIVPRVRANEIAVGADVLLSSDAITFSFAGTQNATAFGGTMNAGMPDATAGDELAESPTFTAFFAADSGVVLDLTGDDGTYENGEQVALIGNELMLVRRVAGASGGFKMEGITRGALGTSPTAHLVNEPVLIFTRGTTSIIAHTVVFPGAVVFAKTRARDGSDNTALGAIVQTCTMEELP